MRSANTGLRSMTLYGPARPTLEILSISSASGRACGSSVSSVSWGKRLGVLMGCSYSRPSSSMCALLRLKLDALLRGMALGREHRIAEQHGDGHRTHAARHRRDPACALQRRAVVHVAGELAFGVAVHADIDHDRAGFDHVAADHVQFAHGADEYVGAPGVLREVPGLGVAQRDRGAGLQEQQRYGLAHDIAAADDHRLLA